MDSAEKTSEQKTSSLRDFSGECFSNITKAIFFSPLTVLEERFPYAWVGDDCRIRKKNSESHPIFEDYVEYNKTLERPFQWEMSTNDVIPPLQSYNNFLLQLLKPDRLSRRDTGRQSCYFYSLSTNHTTVSPPPPLATPDLPPKPVLTHTHTHTQPIPIPLYFTCSQSIRCLCPIPMPTPLHPGLSTTSASPTVAASSSSPAEPAPPARPRSWAEFGYQFSSSIHAYFQADENDETVVIPHRLEPG